jgi:hypothetical protein
MMRLEAEVMMDDEFTDELGAEELICCMTFEADDDETPELLSNKRSSGKSSFRALKSALGTSSPTRGFFEGGPSPIESEFDIFG